MSEELKKMLRRAFNLGQMYWRQADSESYSQNKKSVETMEKFRELVDSADALSRPAPVAAVPEGMVLVPKYSTGHMDVAGADAADLEDFDRFKAETVWLAMVEAATSAAMKERPE